MSNLNATEYGRKGAKKLIKDASLIFRGKAVTEYLIAAKSIIDKEIIERGSL